MCVSVTMASPIVDEQAAREAYEDVRNDASETTWLVLFSTADCMYMMHSFRLFAGVR